MARAAGLLALLVMGLAGCDDLPESTGTTGTTEQCNASVPSGPHLYCIANVGHTMVAYSLAQNRVLVDSACPLPTDPVGSWFHGGRGYYLSRVAGDGSGANALIRFDPVTLAETERLTFPPNSNPTNVLVLPGTDTAWVALRGSTFNSFDITGISAVDLPSLEDTAYCDLKNPDKNRKCGSFNPSGEAGLTGDDRMTSPVGFVWDADCGSGGCAYAVINNWNGEVRKGWLLVLRVGSNGQPVLREVEALGRNPFGDAYLDADNDRLWVVNNGGYGSNGDPGTLWVFDTAELQDDTSGSATPTKLTEAEGVPADPTGIYATSIADTAWLTSYPDDEVYPVDLKADPTTLSLSALNQPAVTGPIYTPAISTGLYAGANGFSTAHLAELDPISGNLITEHDLNAGNGPVTCGAYEVP